jgi:hypothetical protein
MINFIFELVSVFYFIKYLFRKRNPRIEKLREAGIEINSGIVILEHQQDVPEDKLHDMSPVNIEYVEPR